jgi:hypothetical protein
VQTADDLGDERRESIQDQQDTAGRFLGETPAANEIGGDETGATTGVKPGEEPLIPRDARQVPIGNDPAVLGGGHGEGP